MASSFTVLGLFAHPDDETFGPGGTWARLAEEGHATHLGIATRGEAGTIHHSASYGRRRLARMREAEMQAAAAVLGVRSLHQLHLPDSGLVRLEAETLVRPFVRLVRTLRPHVIITFHDGGISGHADHRTVTQRARTAFHAAAEPRWPELGEPHRAARLWCYSIPESRARRVTHRKLHAVPDEDIDAVLDVSDQFAVKMEAVQAHATQAFFIEDMARRLGGLREFWQEECFVLAEARVPLPSGSRPVDNLFAGLSPA